MDSCYWWPKERNGNSDKDFNNLSDHYIGGGGDFIVATHDDEIIGIAGFTESKAFHLKPAKR